MDSLYLEVSGLSYTTFFARCKPAVIVNMKKSFFYLFSVFILIQVSWRKFDQPNKWIISSSSFLRAIWSVITNGHSSHFFNFTESLLYMTYQHKPTEASLLASSWGALDFADMSNTLIGCPTHDVAFIEGALELFRKGEMAIFFHGGCPPGPWVQVDSGTGQRRHVRLPGPAHGNNVQSACCFLNGDHTVSL